MGMKCFQFCFFISIFNIILKTLLTSEYSVPVKAHGTLFEFFTLRLVLLAGLAFWGAQGCLAFLAWVKLFRVEDGIAAQAQWLRLLHVRASKCRFLSKDDVSRLEVSAGNHDPVNI